MITYKELINLGFSDGIIATYLQRGSLVLCENVYAIKSERLFSNIMKRSLMIDISLAKKLVIDASLEDQFYYYIVLNQNDAAYKTFKAISNKSKLMCVLGHYLFDEKMSIDEISIGVIKDNRLFQLYDLLRKYIYLREPSMVIFLIEKLDKFSSMDFETFIIKAASSFIKSHSQYVYDETDFSQNKVCYEYLTNLERQLLFFVEKKEYRGASAVLNELGRIYSSPVPLMVIFKLLDCLENINSLYEEVSSASFSVVVGPGDSVLFELLANKDYYRAYEVINDLRKSSESFSYPLEIYYLLIEEIIKKDKINRGDLLKKIQGEFNGANDDIKLFGNYHFSVISIEAINQSFALSEYEIDENENYYDLYLKDYQEEDYRSAKKNLVKHYIKLKRKKQIFKRIYLFGELDFLIANESVLKRNKEQVIRMRKKAITAENDGNIIRAIYFYQECFKYQGVVNPYELAHIGVLYYQLGNYEEALNCFYQISDVVIKPDDFVIFLLCLLKMNKYNEALDESRKYFYYYIDDNNAIRYIRSICYLNLANYHAAVDEIFCIETINAAYHNNMGSLDFEKDIIFANMQGRKGSYTFDDYIEFGLMESERPLFRRIEKMLNATSDKNNFYLRFVEEAEVIDDFNQRIEYLLSVLKILFLHQEENEGVKIADYINQIVEDCDSIRNKEKILRTTAVYNSNFFEIE